MKAQRKNKYHEQICSSSCEKPLGVIFDCKLTLQSHIDSTCKKAWQKLVSSMSRINPYVEFKKISCKSFFHGPVQLLPINMDVL